MNRLDCFENLAPYKIYKRGEEYYESGAVFELKETSPSEWIATVSGTDDYFVEITIEEDEIVDWYCDCPYDGGDTCKHVIAVLLAIRAEKKKGEKNTFSEKRKGKERVERAIEAVLVEEVAMDSLSDSEFLQQILAIPLKELSAFVLAYAFANPTFKEAFLKAYVSPKISAPKKDYRLEIQKSFQHYHQRGSRYYGRNKYPECGWEATFNKLDQFLNEASLLLKYNSLDVTIAITIQILRSIGEEYDDELIYNDDLCVSDYCERAGDLLLETIKHPQATQEQKNEVLQELYRLAKLDPYRSYDVYDLEELMQQVNVLAQSPEGALELIDKLLVDRKDSWDLYKLVLQKVELLHQMNNPKKAENTIKKYLYLSEIRKLEVEKLVANGQYDEVIHLLDEGIRLSEKDGESFQTNEWMKSKLQIYEKMNHTSAVMSMCRQLFIANQGHLEYYRKLKQIVPPEKWKLFLSSMMKETSFGHSFTWGNNNMSNIYVEEEDYESLFRLLSSYSGREQLVGLMEYVHHLRNDYSEVLIALFTSHLLDYAERNVGRDHYEFVAQGLLCVKKLNGGAVVLKHLMQEFREKYKRRSAMMEILNKL